MTLAKLRSSWATDMESTRDRYQVSNLDRSLSSRQDLHLVHIKFSSAGLEVLPA